MKITITIKDSTARYWLYLLRKNNKSKAGLDRLVKLEMVRLIAKLAFQDEETGYASIAEDETE